MHSTEYASLFAGAGVIALLGVAAFGLVGFVWMTLRLVADVVAAIREKK